MRETRATGPKPERQSVARAHGGNLAAPRATGRKPGQKLITCRASRAPLACAPPSGLPRSSAGCAQQPRCGTAKPAQVGRQEQGMAQCERRVVLDQVPDGKHRQRRAQRPELRIPQSWIIRLRMESADHQSTHERIELQPRLHAFESCMPRCVVYIRKSNNDGSEMLHRSRAGNGCKFPKCVAHRRFHAGKIRTRCRANADADRVKPERLPGERAYVSGAAEVRMLAHQE